MRRARRGRKWCCHAAPRLQGAPSVLIPVPAVARVCSKGITISRRERYDLAGITGAQPCLDGLRLLCVHSFRPGQRFNLRARVLAGTPDRIPLVAGGGRTCANQRHLLRAMAKSDSKARHRGASVATPLPSNPRIAGQRRKRQNRSRFSCISGESIVVAQCSSKDRHCVRVVECAWGDRISKPLPGFLAARKPGHESMARVRINSVRRFRPKKSQSPLWRARSARPAPRVGPQGVLNPNLWGKYDRTRRKLLQQANKLSLNQVRISP